MKKIFTGVLLLTGFQLFSQTVECDIFQKTANATTAQVGFRIRTTSGTIDYIGVSFYLLYQNTLALPQSATMNSVVGVDDSKLTTTFNWGTLARNTNPVLDVGTVDPGAPGGETFNRRYIYGNIDQDGGANIRTLTTAWDTVLYITLNTSGASYPQGGYAYEQATLEAGGASLTDVSFSNIPFIVNSGNRPLGSLVVTPVHFTDYNVKCNSNGTLLTWGTASESNSSKFEIQKSFDGSSWQTIGSVVAAGNSSIQRNYQYVDLDGGSAYYRIRQVDKDAQFVYTDVKRANCEGKDLNVSIYPVPAKDNLNVAIRSTKSAKTELRVIDATGKIVRRINTQITSGTTNLVINVSNLPSGSYILTSNDPDMVIHEKFSVAR